MSSHDHSTTYPDSVKLSPEMQKALEDSVDYIAESETSSLPPVRWIRRDSMLVLQYRQEVRSSIKGPSSRWVDVPEEKE